MTTTAMTAAPAGTTLASGEMTVELTTGGDVHAVRTGGLLVNQYLPGEHDRMPGGVLLRATRADGTVEVARLTGSAPAVTGVETGTDRVVWSGEALGLTSRVALTVADRTLVWRVDLTVGPGTDARTGYDVVHVQDLALAPPAAALSSEAYVCQYLLHRALTHPAAGTVLASRQTMSAQPRLPLAVTFLVEGATAHLTDSLQVFTPLARHDGVPHGLLGPVTSGVLQYEYAMQTLVSRPLDLSTGTAQVHAVTVVDLDARGPLADTVEEIDRWAAAAVATAAQERAAHPLPTTGSVLRDAPLLSGDALDEADLLAALDLAADDVLLPERDADGTLLSFFTPDGAHVVDGRKETLTERSHGHVLKAGDAVLPTDEVLSATAFAPGVFVSHVVLGNTTANRLASVHRHHLNLLRSSGLRVLVDDGEGAHLLGVPSALVLDVGGVHWVYETPLGRVDVRTVAHHRRDRIDVSVRCERGLRVTATLELDDEAGGWVAEHTSEGTVVLRPVADGDVDSHYPDLRYAVTSTAPIALDDASAHRLSSTTGSGGLAVAISGSLHGDAAALELLAPEHDPLDDLEATLAGHLDTVRGLVRGLRFQPHPELQTQELDLLVPWYAHDALIHFLVPHGLEQYSGAAWGTRDVCQGPLELALAGGREDIARQIVLRVLAHQHTWGGFPQWFMFDEYAERYNDSSHGDVVVWPLFALAQYLEASGDVAILDEKVPFWDHAHRRPAAAGPDAEATVLDHVERILDHLETDLLPGTSLPAYGEGDWDDTLQPADPQMRTNLASTWTSALLVQAADLLARTTGGCDDLAPLSARAATLASSVRTDLRERALVDGVMAGYLRHGEQGDELVIHPRDTSTGMRYRLIPMNQSITAGILTLTEAEEHERLIAEHLHFPDGVRLMDHPAAFDEGIPHTFQRAEQAANVGREVGLMYVHAHIRYAEALAALGRGRTLDELLRISPFDLGDRIAHAAPRQRNAYFSSSDADFPDRASFARDFDKLRDGSVGVRGGWRVYSSGPGIYLRQLVQGVLGLTEQAGALVVDPVLPATADGLTVDLELGGRARTVVFRIGAEGSGVQVRAGSGPDTPVVVPASPRAGDYRERGVVVAPGALGDAALVEVTVQAGS
ncbi:GH36-type glycosyl hydrolase domain-containing protein [Oerskovia sp. NPDC057915]|uniref:GH36-type glycosyl hydrolase domain-containing protein n=1 Tax=Oerskovia sp. NPDC057915 TaxID=3346280 RepID=UPI0036DCA33D